jgi:hypothetical protein
MHAVLVPKIVMVLTKVFPCRHNCMRLSHIHEDEKFKGQDPEGEFNAILHIIDGAEEVGIKLTENDVMLALTQTGLDADEVSLNQPVVDGIAVDPGNYTVYKGGSDEALGWVSDDHSLAAQYGNVSVRVFENTGQKIEEWSVVHDWDGYPQLVPPGEVL